MNFKQNLVLSLSFLMIPFCAYSLPEQAPKIGALAIGIVSGSMAIATEKPLFFIPAVITTAAVYKFLQHWTPTDRMQRVQTIFGEMSKDPLVVTAYTRLKGNIVQANKPVSEVDFVEMINSQPCYQEGIVKKDYPLIIARDVLACFQSKLKTAKSLLDDVENDIASDDSENKKLYDKLCTCYQKYFANTASALSCILSISDYSKLVDHVNTKTVQAKKIQLKEQSNQIRQAQFNAFLEQAQAKKTHARAAESYTTLAWIKYIVWIFTGYGKSNSQ
jgi:hypothetical protein